MKDSRLYRYYQIPDEFVYEKVKGGAHYFKGRKNTSTLIGQLNKVWTSPKPAAQEKYYLRLLLLKVKGPKCFDDVKRVPGHNNDQPFATFKEAAIARNLLLDDNEHKACLREASVSYYPAQLRDLFIFLLSLGTVLDPIGLFSCAEEKLIDIDNFPSDMIDGARRAVFTEFERLSLRYDFQFSRLPWVHELDGCPTNLDEFRENFHREEIAQMAVADVSLLNADQKKVVDAIYARVTRGDDSRDNLFFIDGYAGTGKTFVYTTLYKLLVARGLKVLCAAISGIAASMLPGGRTAHKAFGLKLDMDEHNYASNLGMRTDQANYLRSVDLVIWDEISMAPKWALAAVDQLFRDLALPERRNLPFGGKVIVVGGDFRQILPVIKGAMRTKIVDSIAKKFELWDRFQKFTLHTSVRSLDAEHNTFVRSVGDGTIGTVTDFAKGEYAVPIPRRYFFPSSDVNQFIDSFYSPQVLNSPTQLASTLIVANTHEEINFINEQVMRRIAVKDPLIDDKIYVSRDHVTRDGDLHPDYRSARLNEIDVNGFPAAKLHLKVGTVVMLLRNYCVKSGLTNGTRLLITKLDNHLITCQTFDGSAKEVGIPRIKVNIRSQDSGLEFDFTRLQFPLKPAFAMTIHKSQGQTVGRLGIFMRTSVFAHGALYVALSRARNPDDIKIFLPNFDNFLHSDFITLTNIFYPDALL